MRRAGPTVDAGEAPVPCGVIIPPAFDADATTQDRSDPNTLETRLSGRVARPSLFRAITGLGDPPTRPSRRTPDVIRRLARTVAATLLAAALASTGVVPASASEGGSIAGVVTNTEGEALSGSLVTLYAPDPLSSIRLTLAQTRTDSAGAYSFDGLAARSYAVMASGPEGSEYLREAWDDAPSWQTPTVIALAEGEARDGIDFRLALAGVVRGTVTDTAGAPIRGAFVQVRCGEADCSGYHEYSATTDASGRYEIRRVDPGTYLARFTATAAATGTDLGYIQSQSSAFDVAADAVVSSIDAGLTEASMISGVVTNPDGAPERSSTVELHVREGGQWRELDSRNTFEEGRYAFTGLPQGTYALRFWTSNGEYDYVEHWQGDEPDAASGDLVELTPGESATVDHRFVAGATLTGTVTDGTGAAFASQPVILHSAVGDDLTRISTVWTTSAGTFEFRHLRAGSYSIQFPQSAFALGEWWADADGPEAARRVDVQAGETAELSAILERAPVPLEGPSIVGSAMVGDRLTVTASSTRPDATISYQWFAAGTPLAGATSSELAITSSMLGQSISVEATASAPGAPSTARVSEPTAPVLLPATVSAPTVSGSATVGSTLSAQATSSTPGAAISYAWFADGNPISGAASSKLTLGVEHLMVRISVRATATAPGYASVTSAPATIGQVWAGTLTSSVPTIRGSLSTGSTVTADPGAWTGGTSFGYRWYADGQPVDGATGPTLVLTDAFAGKAIRVRVDGTKDGYTPAATVSPHTSKVLRVSTPTLSGTPAVGAKLTAKSGTWATGATLRYQWYASGAPISGATGTTLTLTGSHAGKQITVRVSGSLAGHASASRTSAPTPKVPVAGTPAVSGAAATGSRLTAKPGTWTTGTSFTYQWYADAAAVAGATGSTFVPSTAQAGKRISVRVTGALAGYATVARTSASTGPVYLAPAPAISGTLSVGSTVSVVRGTWTSGSAFTYQWYANGSAISGATATSLKLTSGLAGKQISIRVTGRLSGYPTTSRDSARTPRVIVTAAPSISGTPSVGRTLTANPGTWTAGTTFGYQWYANGTAIPGASARTFVPTASQTRMQLSVRVTGRLEGYATVSRSSAVTSRVALAGTPVIGGTPAVGQTLTAMPGTWTSGTALTYQWYASGSPISGATSTSLKLTGSHAGKQVTVRVTGRLSGYPTVSRDATPTARVMTAGTPTITGTPAVGAALTAAPGTWTTGTALTYAWYGDGVAIEGATANTFTPGEGQVGMQITVRVTGVLSGFATVSTTSARTAVVVPAAPAP